MRKWVKVRFGLTFQDPESIIKYVKGLSKQDPQNRQAALALVLAWLNMKMGTIMNSFATDENASEKTATALEDIISYLAKGWSQGVLDFSEKGLPAAEGLATTPATAPQATPAQASAPIVQGVKMVKANYSTKPNPIDRVDKPIKVAYESKKKSVAYQDPKRAAMMSGRIKL